MGTFVDRLAAAHGIPPQNAVIIADSALLLEVEHFGTASIPFEVSKEKIQLMKFSNASW